jgi:Domain of unknown function (DUF4291)
MFFTKNISLHDKVSMATTLKTYEIRADFDQDTIVVYQAFNHTIADAALTAGNFTDPFSLSRMTWIKPSFLWLMERSNWARKPNQERILAVRITHTGWETALSQAVLTHPETKIHPDVDQWRTEFDAAKVIVQWDPERSLRGVSLSHRAIQVGISRHLIETYVNEWVVNIEDKTPLVQKIDTLIRAGNADKAKDFLPKERVYPTPKEIVQRLGMDL